MKNQIFTWLYITVVTSAIIYTFYMVSGCVAGNETMARLGTIEKNNVTISGQVDDLNLRTTNIEEQLVNNITAENIGQVISKNQKGVFAIGDGGAVWVLGALVAVLGFFGYMVKLLIDRKRLFQVAHAISSSVRECSKGTRTEILRQVGIKSHQRALVSKFVNKNGLHADKENKYANGQINNRRT